MNNNIKQVAERLRGLRESLDLTTTQVAQEMNISVQEYEQYETGNIDIPMNFLQLLAQHYRVAFTSLISGEDPHASSYFVTRKGKGISVERVEAYKYQALASGFKNSKIDPLLVTVEPKDDSVPLHLNTHPTQEFNLVMEGRLLIQINGKDLILEEGDSIYFDASNPHGMKALDGKSVKFLAIII